ncbi:MAG: class I SAM-dependent RNA methyltransferase [Bacteroidales bacterium]|nr:class I SAM-dependent RNA methyltransferase [Bacteroidales bacterium]
MQESYQYVAKTFAGLEGVLAEELRNLGASDVEEIHRAVSFSGTKEIMYKANYLARTAIRVLKPMAEFPAANETDYYRNMSKINWSKYLDLDSTFAIDATVSNSKINHSKYAALKAKDAIVDQFNRKFSKRPNVDTDFPDLRLSIFIHNDHCIVSLDSSSISLHKRGYRRETGEAPLNEVLAAGMILLSDWDKKSHFIDPMCGAGTLVIEAALIANNIPSGYYREYYGFKKWEDYDAELWEKVKRDALDLQEEFEFDIIGNELSTEIAEKAIRNIKHAKLHYDIEIVNGDIADFIPPEGPGHVVVNPPYGERLQTRNIVGLYQTMGDSFKKNYSGYNAWVISSDLEALKRLGLRPSRKIDLWNGPLLCKFEKFELYKGSKKAKHQNFEKK